MGSRFGNCVGKICPFCYTEIKEGDAVKEICIRATSLSIT